MPATQAGSQKGGGMCAGFVLTPDTAGNTLVGKNNPHASGGTCPVLRTRGLVFSALPLLDLVPGQQLGHVIQVLVILIEQNRIASHSA